MSERIYSRIAGTGSYLPEKVLTNDDLSKFVDTSDEWIRSRTGICERHIAAEGQTTGDLGVEAALRALEAAGVDVGHSVTVTGRGAVQVDGGSSIGLPDAAASAVWLTA